ncbi:ATP-binding protein [Candidatus Poribacteria bacterium]
MKRNILYLLLLCLYLLPALPIVAQTASEQRLAAVWRYYPGDSLDWADPEFDDSSWEIVDPRLRPEQFSKIDWQGIGWFRTHIDLPSSVLGKPLGLLLEQAGASEVYIDGELFCRFDKAGAQREGETDWVIGPVHVSFHDKPDHVIAIRYSNSAAEKFYRAGFMAGFGFSLADLSLINEIRINEMARDRMIQGIFSALPFAFGLLHLLLFLFFRRTVENLYFAIAMFLTATSTFLDYQSSLAEHISRLLFYIRFHRLVGFLLVIFILRFMYSLFYKKLPRQFWLFSAVLIATGVLAVYGPERYYAYLNIVSLVALAEIFRVNVVAIYKKTDGAWIIFVGFVIQLVFALYDMLMDLKVFGPVYNIQNAYFLGTFGVIVCMSVYLARDFARTRKNLEIYSEELEERVAERTQSLAEKNEELQTTLRKLTETQTQLVQSGKMAALGNLVAGIAHEVNNPVSAVASASDVLDRGFTRIREILQSAKSTDNLEDDSQLSTTLSLLNRNNQVISTGSRRVAEIVQKLKDFAGLDEAHFRRVDIHEGIDSTLTLIHHELGDNIEIQKEYGELPRIDCYPNELNQVFMNLLVNAAHAIEGKGVITIKTCSDERNVYVQIIDTGTGILPENLDAIFDPGFTTKGGGVGVGLGLSISRNIVEKQHRGEIRVDSEIGKGTTFTIVLSVEQDM